MSKLWLLPDHIFKHPFSSLIAGPTQSGKTFFVFEILRNADTLISPPPDTLTYCYSVWQDKFDHETQKNTKIEFHQGLPSLEKFDPNKNNLIVLDDLMSECENSEDIRKLFTIDSHHRNISVFFLVQNIFSKGKFMRTISLNCHYLVIFKNPRDKSQINVLARQMFPNKSNFFLEAFDDAVEKKSHSYLFVDLSQETEEQNRIQTGILPSQQRIIYTAK